MDENLPRLLVYLTRSLNELVGVLGSPISADVNVTPNRMYDSDSSSVIIAGCCNYCTTFEGLQERIARN